jgi:hypothetical protein
MKKGDKKSVKVDIKIFIASVVITALIASVIMVTIIAMCHLSC